MKAEIAISLLVLAVVAQASWRSDVSSAPISNKLVSGRLHGKPFAPKVITLKKLGINKATINGKVEDQAQAWVLKFASDNDFFPAQDISIWFTTNVGEKLAGRSFALKPYEFGTEGFTKQQYGNRKGAAVPRSVSGIFIDSKNPTMSDQFSDRFSIRLIFTKNQGGKVTGQVNLSLPDKSKSFLAGSFTAVIEP